MCLAIPEFLSSGETFIALTPSNHTQTIYNPVLHLSTGWTITKSMALTERTEAA